MDYIHGKFKQLIYEGDNGYKVGLFRVKEASETLLSCGCGVFHNHGRFQPL